MVYNKDMKKRKLKRMNIQLHPVVHAWLRKESFKQGVSMANILRSAMEVYMIRSENKKI